MTQNQIQTPQKYISIILASFFIVPFLPNFIPDTITLYSFYLRETIPIIIALILLTCFIITQTYSSSNKLYITPTQIIILAFILLIVVQLNFLDSYKTFSFLLLACLWVLLLLSMAVTHIELDTRIFSLIAWCIVFGSYIQCIICILQLYGIHLEIIPLRYYPYMDGIISHSHYDLLVGSQERIVGSIYQTNNLANYLSWGIFANIYLWQMDKKIYKIFFIFNIFLFSTFISLTFSRVVLVYGLFIIIYAFVLLKKHSHYAKLLLVHGVILLSVVAFTAKGGLNFVYPNTETSVVATPSAATVMTGDIVNNQSNSADRIGQTFTTFKQLLTGEHQISLASDNQRIVLWLKGLKMFSEHPIIGVGWGYFTANLFTTKLNDRFPQTLGQYALPFNTHNLFIQLLATTGLIGFAIVFFGFIYWIRCCLKLEIKAQILCLGIIAINIIHSQTEYPLFYTPYLFCFIILAALSDQKELKLQINKKWFNLAAVVTIIVASWQIYVGYNNFMILAQFKPVAHYDKQNWLNNVGQKYQLGNNLLWDYYVDVDLIQKLTLTERTADNAWLFDIMYNATQKVAGFTPYPSYTTKLAIMDQIIGKNKEAQGLINETLDNYFPFRDYIINQINLSTGSNNKAKTALLSYVKNYEIAQQHIK
ncbi:MAG TPA: Wzy polymerase domain-containing protein [Burkholderiales bacterium]|nr:Wzy polymerase domain-containing protein [Burkholderiales bacterium]